MAALDAYKPVQVANVDLALERQKLLRDKLGEFFTALSRRARVKKRLVYTVNAEGDPLDKVLRMNEEADALFTGFNYDASTSEQFKQSLAVETPEDLLTIDPQLRYPVIAEWMRWADQGQFRHRKLILVGDLYEKIGQCLRSALPVTVTFYTDPERKQVSQPVPVTSLDRLERDPGAEPVEGRPIPVSCLSSLQVADLTFHGLINMPEENNRFVFRDATVVDTARKLYQAESVQAQVVRERAVEEKLNFVRGKRVFIVMEPDLEHIVAERFLFDRMDNLYRHHSLADALAALEGGASQGIVDYFERQGYDLVFDLLEQEERDKLLVAVLGDRLTEFLLREVETVKPMIAQLAESDLESLFYNLPASVVDQALEGLKAKSYERFLSMVPPKIREGVILEFLSTPKHIQAAWRGIGEPEKKDILGNQAHLVHAIIYLLDSPLSKARFPALKFEFERNYTSAMLPKMNQEEVKATFSMIARYMESGGVPKGLIANQLEPGEIEKFMVAYISRHPAEFYNRLNPLVRKQIWITVGREYKEHISRKLHALDKIEILKGNKDTTVPLVFGDPKFMAWLQAGEDPAFAALLFLTLKKLDKAESKTALLKKVLGEAAWQPARIRGVPALLTDPDNGLIYEKLSAHVEELEFRFDSLVCTRADHEALKHHEAFAGAVVTLIDDLVDPSLFNLFQAGRLSREEYGRFSSSVDQEIAGLRRKLAARETEDPVGVYLLETMLMLNQLSNEALAGGLSADSLARLDERRQVRQRLLDAMNEHLHRIEDFLAKAGQQLPRFDARIAQLRAAEEKQGRLFDEAYGKAHALLKAYQQANALRERGLADKKKVALTQRELSVQFFTIIQPLILEKVRSLGNPLKSLFRMVGLGAEQAGETSSRRMIFKFSDEEIAHILRYRIVFCAKDPVLAQFVATCLRIDRLEDTLFTLATAETLPRKSDIDILFYGPGYSVADFSDSVKRNRMVSFADEAFYQRLQDNEKLKARTKAVLAKAEAELHRQKPALEAASGDLKALQARRRQLQSALADTETEKRRLQNNLRSQGERRLHFQGEQELLAARLAEVDGRFEELRSRITQLVEQGGEGAAKMLESGRQELGEQLRDELVGLNKELARMMFIKGVKDAGETITRNTQQGILGRIATREVYRYAERPFKKLIVADDGSNLSQNLRRVFVNVALSYFKLRDLSVQEISIQRMLALAENAEGARYPFVALFSERPADEYGALKLMVKKIRNHLPDTYQMLITPFGELGGVDRNGMYYKNLLSLMDNCTLVNAALGDFSEPATVLKVLREKAPLA